MNLLVISDRFPHKYDHSSAVFVKELLKYQSKYFDKIYVISLNPYLPSFISKRFSNPRWYKDSLAQDYSFSNIDVYFAKYFTLKGKYFVRKRDEATFRKILKIIEDRNISFDLIHAHFIHPSGTAAVKLKKIFKKPLIITGHGHDVWQYPFMDERLRDKMINALKIADVTTTVSKYNAHLLKKAGFKGEIEIIPTGYDPDIFKLRNKYNIRRKLKLPINKKVIVSVGRLITPKGHIYLLKALEKLKNVRDDFFVVVIGDGPLKNILLNEVKKRNLVQYINFIGEIDHYKVSQYISAADIFVLPSLNEGMPTVMFESLGCGTPFVGSAVAGIPEIIISEDYGLLTKPADPADLAEKIQIALDKKWNRDKILEYAKQFTWENIAKATMKIYDKALEKYSNL